MSHFVSKADTNPGRGVFVATAGASITAGDVVSYDLSKSGDAVYYTVVPAIDTDGNKTAVAGVALATVASGEEVRVCYWGHVDIVNVDGSTVDGSPLYLGSTAAGRADLTGEQHIGFATSADTDNIASAWINVPRA